MVDQMTLQTIGILLTGLTVSIAAIYYTMTLRYTRRNQELQLETRQAQLFMQIYRDFCSPEWWKAMGETARFNFKDLDEFDEKWGRDTNPEAWARQGALHGFFEGLGLLVYRRLIDPSLVDDLMSAPIMRYWERTREMFLERRKRLESPSIAEWIEYLNNEIKPIYEGQHGQETAYTRTDDRE